MAKRNFLMDLIMNIRMNNSEMVKGIKNTNRHLNSFGRSAQRAGNQLRQLFVFGAIAQTARAILRVATSLGQVSEKARLIAPAFDRIADTDFLNTLRASTKGLVEDLELMRQAVRFQEFGLNLQDLPSILEFATKKAEETGEEMSFLLDSVVIGLGRKSIKVLDNLAINVGKFQELTRSAGLTYAEALNVLVAEKLADSVAVAANAFEQLEASAKNAQLVLAGGGRGGSGQSIADIARGLAIALDRIDEAKPDSAWLIFLESIRDTMLDILDITENDLYRKAFPLSALSAGQGPSPFEPFALPNFQEIADQLDNITPGEFKPRKTDVVSEEDLNNIDQAIMLAEDFSLTWDMTLKKLERFDEAWAEIAETEALLTIQDELDATNEALEETTEVVSDFSREIGQSIKRLSSLLSNTLVDAITGVDDAFKDFGRNALRILLQLGIRIGLIAALGPGGLAIPGFAKGGVASGLALVGEAGPELVNFDSPSRVMSAPATRGLLAGGAGEVVFRISGDELVGILSRMGEKKNYF